MQAAIDVGTNTVRLLIGRVADGRVVPERHFRRITRLGGGYDREKGLASEAMERTLAALREAREIIAGAGVTDVRAVGTAAFRGAGNVDSFLDRIRVETGLSLEVIAGDEEARLCARGVLSALEPTPQRCLIFDIGGGSTEFTLVEGGEVHFQASYPVGVVRLAEDHAVGEQQDIIYALLGRLEGDLQASGTVIPEASDTPLVGTAGTVTTLAALRLGMVDYDWRRVNNLVLETADLASLLQLLASLSGPEREELPGMEKGRGDLIVPGLRLVLGILEHFGRADLKVSDFGLLEGVLLEMG